MRQIIANIRGWLTFRRALGRNLRQQDALSDRWTRGEIGSEQYLRLMDTLIEEYYGLIESRDR